MKQLSDWSCDFKLDTNTSFTVGQKFAILCQGSTPMSDKSLVKIEPKKEENAYDLVLVREKFKSSNELFLSVTSWKVGKHKLGPVKIIVGDNFILTDGPTINVATVLSKDTQMNPPPGAMLFQFPKGFMYGLGFLLVVLFAFLIKGYRRSRRIDRGMLKLHSLKTSLNPYFEFQKQIRVTKKSLEKNMTSAELIDLCSAFYKSLVIFVSFQVKSPLFILKDKEVVKVLSKKKLDKKTIKEYFYINFELKKTLMELTKEGNVKTLKSDLENLVEETVDFSYKLNQFFVEGHKS